MSQIILPVKSETIADYIRSKFNAKKCQPVELNLKTDDMLANKLGKLITGAIDVSEFPKKTQVPEGYHPVEIIIPRNSVIHTNNNLGFIYYKNQKVEILNYLIEVIYDIDFYVHMMVSSELGLMKKDSIEAFVYGKILNFDPKRVEMNRKRHYRNDKNLIKHKNKWFELRKNQLKFAQEFVRKVIIN